MNGNYHFDSLEANALMQGVEMNKRQKQIQLEQKWWMELGSRVGWRLSAHTYCDEATFITNEFPRATIDITASQRNDILNAIALAPRESK